MPPEPRAPYWIRRLTDGQVVGEAADYEAAWEAMWMAWQRGWMVEAQIAADAEGGVDLGACA